MRPAALNAIKSVLYDCNEEDTEFIKLLNSVLEVNPQPDAETDPVREPAFDIAPCEGEKWDVVELKEAVFA